MKDIQFFNEGSPKSSTVGVVSAENHPDTAFIFLLMEEKLRRGGEDGSKSLRSPVTNIVFELTSYGCDGLFHHRNRLSV